MAPQRGRAGFAVLAAVVAAASVVADPSAPHVDYALSVDCSDAPVGSLPHFWQSCGFTPAELMLRADERENIRWIGSTPRREIRQVRIHYILDLLTAQMPPNSSVLQYDWQTLDATLDLLVANELQPGLEIMGSPAGFPPLPQAFWAGGNGSSAAAVLDAWSCLVRDVIVHYSHRYGVEFTQTWLWEGWNEPDCGWGWQPTNESVAAYLDYWDATAAGVAAAEQLLSAKFMFGGPATCSGPNAKELYNHAFFAHVDSGRSALTGGPVRLDFITTHVKGGTSSAGVMAGEQQWFDYWQTNHPRLLSVPYLNDEGDPEVGWDTSASWRRDARYPAVVAKVFAQHIAQYLHRPPYNFWGVFMDVGFMTPDDHVGLNYRTLMARFSARDGQASETFAFVRRDGLNLYAALSRLGDRQCRLSGAPANTTTALFGAVATLGLDAMAGPPSVPDTAVLLYNSDDCTDATGPSADVTLTLAGLPYSSSTPLMLIHHRIDNDHANPFAVWNAQGQPPHPSAEQLAAMWEVQSPALLAPPAAVQATDDGRLALAPFTLPLPGVSLVHIVVRPDAAPSPPAWVRAYVKAAPASWVNATAVEILVRWSCENATNKIAAYAVTVGPTASGPFTPAVSWHGRLQPDWTCAFLHIADSTTTPVAATAAGKAVPSLFYRVSAIDYWSRQSDWSAPWPAEAA